MSNIIINGETYEGVESISANTPDGGTATYLSETELDKKLNKVTTTGSYNRLYAIKYNGEQITFNVSESVINNGVVQRNGTQVKVPETPEADNDATSKKYIDEQISDVRDVAEGKTKSFTVDTLTALGSLFGIDTTIVADEYVITTTTISYKDQSIELKQGDLFLIVDTNVPDYWVSIDDMKLYKMETTKVDLSEYAKNDALNELINKMYPVGSIYMSVLDTNPGTLFGGIWEAWGSGKVPVGVNTEDEDFSTVEYTGGSKQSSLPGHSHSYTYKYATSTDGHTLTNAEMPEHSHYFTLRTETGSANAGSFSYSEMSSNNNKHRTPTETSGGSDPHSHTITNSTYQNATMSASNIAEGMTSDNGNLQPYITCYMWKRVA